MAATAALSAATVGELVDRGQRRLHGADGRARDRDRVGGAARRPPAARVPRQLHLRAGAQGLHRRPRADDHRRPAAEAVRRREGGGDFFEKLWDCLGNLGDTSGLTLAGRRSARSRSCSGCGGSRPACPARWSPSRWASRWSSCSRLDDHGVEIVGHDRQRPAVVRPAGRELRRLRPRSRPGRSGVMLVGFAEGLGAAKTYAAREHYEIDAEPRADRARRGEPRRRPVERHGRQRQPLQDRRQRRRPARDAALGARRRRPDVVTLLFLTGLFE